MDIQTDRLIRRQEVQALVGIGHTALYRWMHEGRFPRPVKVGSRAVRWRLSDVQAWIDGLETT